MLYASDTPSIRFALHRRLDHEPGVQIVDIKFEKYKAGDRYTADLGGKIWAVANEPFIRVGVLATLGGTILTRSRFDLPVPFEIGHLRNEIDEIAEQYKAARKEYFGRGHGVILTPETQLRGTGLRGRWADYGTRADGKNAAET